MTRNQQRKIKVKLELSALELKFIARALNLYGHNYCPQQLHPSWKREERKALALSRHLDQLRINAEPQ